MKYYIWCDESVTKGKYFSNFYGGVLVSSSDFETINTILQTRFQELKLGTELKWSKINTFKEEGYKQMMDIFFEFVKKKQVKIRIMFTKTDKEFQGETNYHQEHKYHLLYYQFIKHGFGLQYLKNTEPSFIEFFFDHIPDTKAKNELFKNHIFSLQRLPKFQKAGINIQADAIAEVNSEKHVFLQCLDVVLGAMAFRLNKKHLEIPEGKKRRGKRTLAKERVYKHILAHIQNIHPKFNIGITTGLNGDKKNHWEQPYRHWRFLSKHMKKSPR